MKHNTCYYMGFAFHLRTCKKYLDMAMVIGQLHPLIQAETYNLSGKGSVTEHIPPSPLLSLIADSS